MIVPAGAQDVLERRRGGTVTDLTPCPECGSADQIPNAAITVATTGGGGSVWVEVDANPDAMFFKGTKRGVLEATVCGGCGLVRLYTDVHRKLLAAYRNQPNA